MHTSLPDARFLSGTSFGSAPRFSVWSFVEGFALWEHSTATAQVWDFWVVLRSFHIDSSLHVEVSPWEQVSFSVAVECSQRAKLSTMLHMLKQGAEPKLVQLGKWASGSKQ